MDQIKKLIKSIWLLPIVILLILIIMGLILIGFSKLTINSLFNSFGGALVGVLLGFIAEIIRENFKDFQKENKDREIYLKLLKEDAKCAHYVLWAYKKFIQNPTISESEKNQIPPEFGLKYWTQLSKDQNFLKFGIETPFDKIFEIMWDLEKINDQTSKAEKGNRYAYRVAEEFYKIIIEKEKTLKLLLCFMKKEDITKMESEWPELNLRPLNS